MNKQTWIVVMAMSLVVAGCGKTQDQPQTSQSSPLAEQMSAAKAAVQETQATVAKESSELKVAAENQVAAVKEEQNIQQVAGDLAQKAQTLLAQAKQLLDAGKFDEAITAAQNVLSFDPQNLDAKNIIEQAKAKLQALATEKAGALKTDLMNKIGVAGK